MGVRIKRFIFSCGHYLEVIKIVDHLHDHIHSTETCVSCFECLEFARYSTDN